MARPALITPEHLKELEQAATPWEPQWWGVVTGPDGKIERGIDRELLYHLRRLAPHLIALWEEVNKAEIDSNSDEWGDLIQLPQRLSNAIDALNNATGVSG